MRKFYGLLILVGFVSCASLPTYILPTCSSPEDAEAWINQNIEYNIDDRIASPEETVRAGAGCCIDTAILCLAMVKNGTGEEGRLVFYNTPYGEHTTARFQGYEYGYIEDSHQIGRTLSYRDAMGLVGHIGAINLW
jgi:hypothetical protein